MHGPAVSAQPIEDLPFLARKAVGQIFEYPGKFAGLRLRLADGEPDFVGENIIPVERGILFLQKLFQRGLDAFKIMEIFQQTASFPPTGTCGRADFLNDVALLTIVPLTIVIAQNARTDPVRLIILETLAANLFSALTPFGNPQNLYLYSYFHIPPAQFFAATVPFCAGSAVVLAALGLGWNRGGRLPPAGVQPEIREPKLLMGAAVAFVCNILSVLHIVDTRISLAVTVGIFLVLAPRLFRQVDYFLLLTFVLFFLFTGSITAIPAVRTFFAMALHSRPAVLLYAAGLSQVLSNVPTAVLLSGFTSRYRELLYGVSAGGLGTPVASLASIISYKLYIRKYPGGHYVRPFTIVNFGVLALLLAGLLLGERGV